MNIYLKKVTKISLVAVLVIAFMFGLTGPTAVLAVTSPSLGVAATFGILAGTFTPADGTTTITGDLGYTTLSAGSYTVSGSTYIGGGAGNATYVQAENDMNDALTALNLQTCTENLGAIVDLSTVGAHPTGVYTPGVYCSTGAMSIGTGGITLSGAGTYNFRAVGALNTVAGSVVTLADSASSCDVFWTPTAATTLNANSTFIGTILDNQNAITVYDNTTWTGRALSYLAGTVTTHTGTVINSTCTTAAVATPAPSSRQPATINVVKTVINDNGRTKIVADFPLFVNGASVVSGVTNTFPAPAPVYTVTETGDSNYTRTFSGDCDVNGQLNLNPGDNKFCIVTNNDIGAPIVVPPVPPLIDVLKVPSPLALPAGPGPVTYTYTLKNIGTVPVADITMVGDTCSPIVRISGDTNGDNKLDVTETWVHTCATTLTETHTNIVTATGWANGISAVDIASATVVVGAPIIPPLIHIVKIPSVFTLSAPGGAVTYMYTVTNPGAAPLNNVSITDDKCTGLPGRVVGHPGDLNHNDLLESNESWSFTCKSNLTQTTTNTGTVQGSANGLTARDFALATVVVADAVPKLPSAGIAPSEKSFPWNLIVLSGILILISIPLRSIVIKYN